MATIGEWFYKTLDEGVATSHAWELDEEGYPTLPDGVLVWDAAFLNQFIDRANVRLGASKMIGETTQNGLSPLGRMSAGSDSLVDSNSSTGFPYKISKFIQDVFTGNNFWDTGISVVSGTTEYSSGHFLPLASVDGVSDAIDVLDDYADTEGKTVEKDCFEKMRVLLDATKTIAIDADGNFFGKCYVGSSVVHPLPRGVGDSGQAVGSDTTTDPDKYVEVYFNVPFEYGGDSGEFPGAAVWPFGNYHPIPGRVLYSDGSTCNAAQASWIYGPKVKFAKPGVHVAMSAVAYKRGERVGEVDYDPDEYPAESAYYSACASTALTSGSNEEKTLSLDGSLGPLEVGVGDSIASLKAYETILTVICTINDSACEIP